MADPFIGEIRTVGFNYAPQGWATCSGQLLSIGQNAALFALLGTMYGGNGTSNFQLPNLQGRVVVDVGVGPSGLVNYQQGQIGGVETTQLTTSQMPLHTHLATFTPTGGGGGITVNASLQAKQVAGGQRGTQTAAPSAGAMLGTAYDTASTASPVVYAPSTTTGTAVNLGGLSVTASGGGGITGGTVTNAPTGGSSPVPIMQPFLVLLNIIAMEGIFPPRP